MIERHYTLRVTREKLESLALYEGAAARLINISLAGFRRLVKEGQIPAVSHYGSRRRMYLKDDLLEYLSRLKSGNISLRELPPAKAEKGNHDEMDTDS